MEAWGRVGHPLVACRTAAHLSGNDCRKVASARLAIPTVRKESARIAYGAAHHVIDMARLDSQSFELGMGESTQIAVRPPTTDGADNRRLGRDRLKLSGH